MEMIEKERAEIFTEIEQSLRDKGFHITAVQLDRPWGGFCMIDENQTEQFAYMCFNGVDLKAMDPSTKITGKLLFVAPGKRLSWQYHLRRNEFWHVIKGNVGVVTSDTDEENAVQFLSKGNHIMLPALTRHRLVGLDQWSIVAEIWQHNDPLYPSDEDDIIRIQDDFDRETHI